MGIAGLNPERAGGGIPIDDVLEGLSEDVRAHLETVLRARQPNGTFSVPRHEIIEACEDDGYIVTDWSIRGWRRRHADR